jgi:hypothetical protein
VRDLLLLLFVARQDRGADSSPFGKLRVRNDTLIEQVVYTILECFKG